MTTKTVHHKTTVYISLTQEEIINLIIAKYADIPLVSVTDVEFEYSSCSMTGATLSYEIHSRQPVQQIE